MSRLPILFALLAACAAPAAAQTVRFQTTIGAFDMTLNPTNNPNLQPHVDNLLASVAGGLYNGVVVNRADADFVLQIGSFQSDSAGFDDIPSTGFEAADSFAPLIVDADEDGQVDFSTAGLSNTAGTVSLALAPNDPNSGALSFFVSLSNNAFLDAQGFVPFAQVDDLTVVNQIVNQPIVDISADVGQPGSLAFIDVPLQDNGDLILIESATVVSDEDQVFVGPIRQQFLAEAAADSVADDPGSPTPDSPPGDDSAGDDGAMVDLDALLAMLTQAERDLITMPQFMSFLEQVENGTLPLEEALDVVTAIAGAAGDTPPPPSAGVTAVGIPEPGSAVLAAIALLAGGAARRR